MLIERDVCLFSPVFLNNRQQPASDCVISFSQHKNYITVKFAMGCIQLNEKLVARLKNWTVLKRKRLDFANTQPMLLLSSSS